MCVNKKCNWYLSSDLTGLDCSKAEFDQKVLERICCSKSSDWVKAWRKEHNEDAFGENGSACLLKATPPGESKDVPDDTEPDDACKLQSRRAGYSTLNQTMYVHSRVEMKGIRH